MRRGAPNEHLINPPPFWANKRREENNLWGPLLLELGNWDTWWVPVVLVCVSLSLLGGQTLVPLLGNGQLDTLALRQRDVGLVTLP